MTSEPSASLLIPAESLSPEFHSADGFLRPGTFISRQLADNDRSFIIHFYKSHIILSFNTAKFVDHVGDGALWVRVGILEGKSLAAVGHSGENLILLKDISVGSEVAIEDSQARFYVQWNGGLISIQYHY